MNHFLLLSHCPSAGIRAFCVGLYLSPGKVTHTLALRVSSSFVTHRAFSLASVRKCSVCAKSASNLSTLCHRPVADNGTAVPMTEKIAVCGASRLIIHMQETLKGFAIVERIHTIIRIRRKLFIFFHI